MSAQSTGRETSSRRAAWRAARAARLAAVQVLYAQALSGRGIQGAAADLDLARRARTDDGPGGENAPPSGGAVLEDDILPVDRDLLEAILRGVEDAHAAVQGALAAALAGRPVKRVDVLLRAILTAGVWEVAIRRAEDAPLLIAEYMAITESFYAGRELSLVNAALDAAARAGPDDAPEA